MFPIAYSHFNGESKLLALNLSLILISNYEKKNRLNLTFCMSKSVPKSLPPCNLNPHGDD